MSDPSQHPLTDQALKRLQQLADGNGLEAKDIVLVDTQEQIHVLEAVLKLTPSCEIKNVRYPGPVQGKGRQILSNVIELKQEVERRKKEFMSGSDWIPAVINELKAAQGSGWGYHDATISLDDKSVILAASATCPQCQGRQLISCQSCQGTGQIVCPQCHGRRQEPCIACGGHGETPGQPGQPCTMCHGTRLSTCRACQAQGQVACQHCQGRGGTPCPGCQGTGQISEEVGIICGAKTNFKLQSTGLPSGLRRGLDRLEFVNLSKGHADIEMLQVKAEDDDETPPPKNDGQPVPPVPKVKYRATMPYADAKIRFGQYRPSAISIFGKRGVMMNVPPFLDEALEPWRNKLKQAVAGKAPLEQALEARAIREVFGFEITGKGSVKELRRIYSIGLSNQVAQEIFTHMRLALNVITFKLRSGIAAAWVFVAAGLFWTWFTSLRQQIVPVPAIAQGGLCDMALLLAVMVSGWLSLSSAIRFILQRRFPQFRIPLQHKIGKTGYAMLTGIVLAFIAIVFLEPHKPVWIELLMHRQK